MSLEQYKDANRKELWNILQIQVEHIAELESDNAKLKKEVDKHRGGFVACMTGKQFTINNLKQQAEGILDAVEYLGWEDMHTDTCPSQNIGREFRFVAGQLTKQAKELKEQDE